MQDVMKVLDETRTVVGPAWVEQRESAVERAVRSLGEVSAEQDNTSSPSRMVR
jgi:hypothetical protein